MSEDIQGEAVPPRRRKPRPPVDDDYGPEPDVLDAPFPGTVTAAGVIWIVYGCLIVLYTVVVLFVSFVLAGHANGAGNANGEAGASGDRRPLRINHYRPDRRRVPLRRRPERPGHRPRHAGQRRRVDHPERVGAGRGRVAEIALGQFAAAGGSAMAGAMLLTAGVLALVGRSPYRLWKRGRGSSGSASARNEWSGGGSVNKPRGGNIPSRPGSGMRRPVTSRPWPPRSARRSRRGP